MKSKSKENAIIMSLNFAAWLDAPGKPLRIDPAPYAHPGLQEILIKVHAVAINPVDALQQSAGIMIKWFPFIGGCDVAGEVVSFSSRVVALIEAASAGLRDSVSSPTRCSSALDETMSRMMV